LLACIVVVVTLAALPAEVASARPLAHEPVTAGPYTLTVGWTSEPPIAGQLNGLELHIVRRDTGAAVTGAEGGLNFEVLYGGQTVRLPLRPVEGEQEGAYTADILPTERGKYTFHFSGTIGSDPVDASVEVEEVQPLDEVQVPPVPLSDPNADLLGVVLAVGAIVLGRRR
jgi:hypothetical protein